MMAQSYNQNQTGAMLRESNAPIYASFSNPAPNNRASTRLSTYSMTPTLTPSVAPSRLSCAPSLAQSDAPSEAHSEHTTTSMTPSEKQSPLVQDIRTLASGLARLDQPKLQNQRYEVSENKKEDMSKLALGAKLDRALGRRMVGQDASFSKKKKQGHGVAMGRVGMSEKEVVF